MTIRMLWLESGVGKVKVVQLFKIYLPDNGGGIAAVMKSIANILRGEEQEIVVCHGLKGRRTTIGRYQGVKVRRCRQFGSMASTPLSLSYLIQIYKTAKNADLVIAHFPYPMTDLALLLGLYKGRFVVWWHCDIGSHRWLLRIYQPLMKRTLHHAEKILVPSEGMAIHSKFLKKYHAKCMAIPFGLERSLINRADDYLRKQPATHSICRILFLGRLVWYKGCDILLQAMSALEHGRKEKYELTIAGTGPLMNTLQVMSKRLGLSCVRFAGSVTEEEKIRLIEACDFLVLPSVSEEESFAIVQLEAMAFGKPVINTKIPSGVPYVSVDGKTGITVKPGSVRQLAEAIKKLGCDHELRRMYGKNAADVVRETYVEERLKERYEALFAELGL